LEGAGRKERVAAVGQCRANEELQFSQLVSAASDTHEIVALCKEARTAKRVAQDLLEPREPLDRRWSGEQLKAANEFSMVWSCSRSSDASSRREHVLLSQSARHGGRPKRFR